MCERDIIEGDVEKLSLDTIYELQKDRDSNIKEGTKGENLPEKLLEALEFIGKQRKSWRRMLETYVPLTGYSAPKKPRILNLGCGRCDEAYVLSGYFGNKQFGYDSKDVLVVGVDIKEKEIEKAKWNHLKPDFTGNITQWVEPSNYRFIHGDARKLKELVYGEFDVVVARCPNVAEIPDIWYTIFRESNGVMKSEGLLIATSFSDIEHQMLQDVVKRAGYNIKLSNRNEYGIPTNIKEVSIDRNVLFARK